jgi:hypothetical protein
LPDFYQSCADRVLAELEGIALQIVLKEIVDTANAKDREFGNELSPLRQRWRIAEIISFIP